MVEAGGPKEIKEYARLMREEKPFWDPELRELANRLNVKLVGSGVECAAIAIDNSPEKVFAITFGDMHANTAKRLFYMQRILSTLFPHNFPRFYAASGAIDTKDGKSLSGTVREMIHGIEPATHAYEPDPYGTRNPKTTFIQAIKILLGKVPRTKYPFKTIWPVLQQMNIKISLDDMDNNYILGEDGGEYYLDITAPRNPEDWNGEEIARYMQEQNFSTNDQKKVLSSLERIRALMPT